MGRHKLIVQFSEGLIADPRAVRAAELGILEREPSESIGHLLGHEDHSSREVEY